LSNWRRFCGVKLPNSEYRFGQFVRKRAVWIGRSTHERRGVANLQI
jgi:hypothetical protein